MYTVAVLLTLGLIQTCIACEESFVGGGWAGVYSAYRRSLVVADPSTLCLFERSNRFGGRTYSVPVTPDEDHPDEFILDVGAYRFSPDMHLPGDLIMNHFKLPTKCYEPGCLPTSVDFPKPYVFNYSAPLRIVVQPGSQRAAGYVTPILRMVEAMSKAGVKIYKNTELIDIEVDFKTRLTFSRVNTGDRITVDSKQVFLNLPRHYLMKIPGIYTGVQERTLGMLKCARYDLPKTYPHLSNKPSSSLSKVYLYYSDAWWITKLNQTMGDYPNKLPTVSKGIYIRVRWNDGPTICSSDKSKCHGFLEVYYSHSNETFYSSLVSDGQLGQIKKSDSAAAAEHLDRVHAALLDAIEPLLTVKKEILVAPTMMVIGKWSMPKDTPTGIVNNKFSYGDGYTAPTRVLYSLDVSSSLGEACEVPGLTEVEYRDTVLQPFGPQHKVFLMNNDWIAIDSKYMYGSWAEESLLQAERALVITGTKKPTWLNTDYYKKFVLSRVRIEPEATKEHEIDFVENDFEEKFQ